MLSVRRVWQAVWLTRVNADTFPHSTENLSGKLNDEVIKGLVFGVKLRFESEFYHSVVGVFLHFLWDVLFSSVKWEY